MKRCLVGALTALLTPAGLIAAAPPANAGCLYGGPFISKCDGPVQSDGSWQRCTAVAQYVPSGFSSHLVPVKRCDLMGPGQPAWDAAFSDPPTHIDD
jgi:hypothetical protein